MSPAHARAAKNTRSAAGDDVTTEPDYSGCRAKGVSHSGCDPRLARAHLPTIASLGAGEQLQIFNASSQ